MADSVTDIEWGRLLANRWIHEGIYEAWVITHPEDDARDGINGERARLLRAAWNAWPSWKSRHDADRDDVA